MPKSKRSTISSLFRSKKKENPTPTAETKADEASKRKQVRSTNGDGGASNSLDYINVPKCIPTTSDDNKDKRDYTIVGYEKKISEKIFNFKTGMYDSFRSDKTHKRKSTDKTEEPAHDDYDSVARRNVKNTNHEQPDGCWDENEMPSVSKRPDFEAKYSSYLEKHQTVKFDESKDKFKTQIDLKQCSTKSKRKDWFYIQMHAHKAQPCIAFGKLDLHFENRGELDNIKALLSKGRKCLTDDQFRFIAVKLESIKSIYYTSEGQMSEARELIDKLENEVEGLEPCDITAWFFIAKFWYLVKQAQLTNSRFSTEEFKGECTAFLEKAKKGFQTDDVFFTWEVAMIKWWLFLVSAGLVLNALECATTDQPGKRLSQEDKEKAQCHLDDFQAEINASKMFPTDNDHFQRLLETFQSSPISDVKTKSRELRPKMVHPSESSKETPESKGNGSDEQREEVASRLYIQFIRSMRRKLPTFIQRVMKSEIDHTIYIYTTDTESRDYNKFLRDINFTDDTQSFYRIIKLDAPITVVGKEDINDKDNVKQFANSEGHCDIRAHQHVQPGDVIFTVPKKKKKQVPKYLDDLMQREDRPCTWSIGFLAKVMGPKGEGTHLVTCAHCLSEHDRIGKKQAYFSAYEKKSKKNPQQFDKVIDEIPCYEHFGFYGCYEFDEDEFPNIVDILTIQIDDKYLKKPNVDMFITKDNKPLDMKIFEGNMDDLMGMTVCMRACMSDFHDAIGTIVDANVGVLNVDGDTCCGAIAIKLNDSFYAAHKRRIAREGDSGGLIFAYDSAKDEYLAIGLIWGKNGGVHHVANNGNTFTEVTYCSPLKLGLKYLKLNGFNMKYHVPESVSPTVKKSPAKKKTGVMAIAGHKETLNHKTTTEVPQSLSINTSHIENGPLMTDAVSSNENATQTMKSNFEKQNAATGSLFDTAKHTSEEDRAVAPTPGYGQHAQTNTHAEPSESPPYSENSSEKQEDTPLPISTASSIQEMSPLGQNGGPRQVTWKPEATKPPQSHANGSVLMRRKSATFSTPGKKSEGVVRHSIHSCTIEECKLANVIEKITRRKATRRAVRPISMSLNSYFS